MKLIQNKLHTFWNRKVVGQEQKGNPPHPPVTTFKNTSADSSSRNNTHWRLPPPSKLRRSEMANWFFNTSCLFRHCDPPVSNKQSLSSSEPTDSLNQTQSGRYLAPDEKKRSEFSLISALSFCSVLGFGGLSVLSCHTPTREEALLVSTVHTNRRTHYSKAAAVIALRVITAAQQHGFPLTVLYGHLELNCLPPVRSSQPVRDHFLFLLPSTELSSS